MKTILSSLLILIVLLAGPWLFWQWGFCRFYVDPGEMAIITAKTGDPLDPGQILAKDNQKGVREKVLGEGRHFLNPIFFEHEIRKVITIPAGKIGIVTSKVGKDLPNGEFLADPGQKGIWRKVLGPGKYRLNPVGYNIDVVDATSIPIGFDGVVTSLSGSQPPSGQFAGTGQKGIWKNVLQPGLYYVNPREYQVNVLEIGVNQVSLLGRQGAAVFTKTQISSQNQAMQALEKNMLKAQQAQRDDYFQERRGLFKSRSSSYEERRDKRKKVAPASTDKRAPAKPGASESTVPGFVLSQFVSFPSRDGFEISLDMTVEFELLPKNIAWIYKNYGDLPAAVEKIIMPTILSVSRLKGSAYGARDFIVGAGREKFQTDLTETLARILAQKGIIVYSALIRHVSVPMQILDPIQQASIAQEEDLTNKEKQNTARKLAELNTEKTLIEQRRQQVAQETRKLKAEINARQLKEVAEIRATTMKLVAEIDKETAAVRAEKTKMLGKADADAYQMIEGESANGFQLKVKAFGDPQAYGLWAFAQGLPGDMDIRIIHAGEGTFWTDLEKTAGMSDLTTGALLQKGKKK